MVNIQKANACSPWTPCFKIKEASIITSEDKIKIKSLQNIFFSILEKKCWWICKPQNRKEVALKQT